MRRELWPLWAALLLIVAGAAFTVGAVWRAAGLDDGTCAPGCVTTEGKP